MRQLAEAHLVQYLARLGVAVIVALCRLILAEHVQRGRGELWIYEHRLQGGDQAVSAEQRGEPRQAGGRHEAHRAAFLLRQAKCRHVVDRLVEGSVQLLVGSGDAHHAILPRLQRLGGLGRGIGVVRATQRRGFRVLAVAKIVEQAAMPGLPRCEFDTERQAPVGIAHLPIRLGMHAHATFKIRVHVGGTQVLVFLRPNGGNTAAAYRLA